MRQPQMTISAFWVKPLTLLAALLLVGCASTRAIRSEKGTPAAQTEKGFRPLASLRPTPKVHKKGKRIALLIGINRYTDRAWHGLRFAAKDASDLADVLRNPKTGGFDQVLLARDATTTTRAGVLKAFQRLRQLNTSRQDTIFVYISGHGTLARDPQHVLRRYLVTYDTRQKNIHKSALSIALLRHRFARLKSERKVMLLATCHSGSGKSRLNQTMLAELKTIKGAFFTQPIEDSSRATIFLAVCAFGETARESAQLQNDIYTHYFIKALKHRYDANGDGAVTVSEAHDYAREMTYFHTKGAQRPYAESDILGSDPIILSGQKKRNGKPVLYAYDSQFQGVEVQVNGVARGTFPKGIPLSPGRQQIVLKAGESKLFEGMVVFQDGERIDAKELFGRKTHRFAIALKAGYQFFLQGSSADVLSRELPLFGIELKLNRPWSQIPLDFRFEFAFARNSHKLFDQDNRPQTVTEYNIAFAATYVWKINWFSLFVGPRLSAIYLERQSDIHKQVNDFFFSFQPGVVLGMEMRFLERWSFFAEGRVNYTYVATEYGPPRHQGSYEFLGGVFVHF
ncbi:MAG: caspase family protein [Myxococcales bacterium]|nr:caspase family protein [Myxococcales bacterium]MCB9642056.1 caspase family protein [Myxococcales bacterium]